jgi:uncharacterized protein
MPFGYPGVYVEEAPSDVHVIAGVPTSTAAFLGATKFGPVAAPVLVHGFAEFEARFGGLSAEMPLGYAVRHFFLNGGRDALIARVEPAGSALTDADLSDPALDQQRRGLWLLGTRSVSTFSAFRRCRAPPTSDGPPGMPRPPTRPGAAPW